GTARNWAYFLQRVTGVFLLFYIAYHVWTTRFSGSHDLFSLMQTKLRDPVVFVFYVLGVLAASYHFGNGLWGFSVTWAITVGRRAQRLVAAAGLGAFLLFSLAGIHSLLGFLGRGIPFIQGP